MRDENRAISAARMAFVAGRGWLGPSSGAYRQNQARSPLNPSAERRGNRWRSLIIGPTLPPFHVRVEQDLAVELIPRAANPTAKQATLLNFIEIVRQEPGTS